MGERFHAEGAERGGEECGGDDGCGGREDVHEAVVAHEHLQREVENGRDEEGRRPAAVERSDRRGQDAAKAECVL
jgi:hypothetical protein